LLIIGKYLFEHSILLY